jgi:hypothetical protein
MTHAWSFLASTSIFVRAWRERAEEMTMVQEELFFLIRLAAFVAVELILKMIESKL